jgi:hypothetical protein
LFLYIKFKFLLCFQKYLRFCSTIDNSLGDKRVSEIKSLLAKCRAIVGHFRHSPVATASLEKCQAQLGLPQNRLKQDVSTRWNSEYEMLARLWEQREAVTLCLSTVESVSNLVPKDWTTVSELLALLKPMYDVTVLMCSNEYPTLSMVIPVVNGLMHLLREMTGGLNILRSVMIEKLEQRFGNIEDNDEYCYATILDPRFKTDSFQDSSKK